MTGLTNTIEENPFRDHQLMVDSIRSNREEEDEEQDEAEQGFVMEKIDSQIEIVSSRSPTYKNPKVFQMGLDLPVSHQMNVLYEGEGISPPNYDERAIIDGAESEGGDEDDDDETAFQHQNFITQDIVFTGAMDPEYPIDRDTLDLGQSRHPDYIGSKEQIHYEANAIEEMDEREADLQY